MTISGSFEIIPPDPIEITLDEPDVPKFRYSNAEREDLLKRGMTKEAIDAKEIEISMRLIENKKDREQEEDIAA